MNKEWFIFKGTHHLGPFTVKEMEAFFRSGEINALSLVWKEGAEKWESLAKTKEFHFLVVEASSAEPVDVHEDDLPPPIPPRFLSQAEDLPPPVPLDAFLDPSGIKKVFKDKKGPGKSYAKETLLLFAIFFVGILGWFFINEKSSLVQLRVKGVMPVYLEKLQETAANPISSFTMTMALSLDGKTLFAASNKDGEILTVIKLQSLPKRILGPGDVELMVKGVMKDHLGEYDKMQLSKGPQFAPGEYQIQFNGRKRHFLNKNFRFLNEISFFKKLNSTYSYQTTALIYAGTPREFEKKLTEYQETLTNEKLKPLNERLERLQTLNSLLNKTMEEYSALLEKMKKTKEIEAFEQMYLKEVSPIVQSLVVAANDLSKTVDSYAEQVQFGKQIGEFASEIITETAKAKSLDAKEKKKLKSYFENRYMVIKVKIDSSILDLQEQIKKAAY